MFIVTTTNYCNHASHSLTTRVFANCLLRPVSNTKRLSAACMAEMLRRKQVYMMCALCSIFERYRLGVL